jgi:hypothetical protein
LTETFSAFQALEIYLIATGMGDMAQLLIILTLASAIVSEAGAGPISPPDMGTPEQRREAIDACGGDAQRYCRELKASDGALAYLACLEKNRSRLRSSCVGLLARYGQ